MKKKITDIHQAKAHVSPCLESLLTLATRIKIWDEIRSYVSTFAPSTCSLLVWESKMTAYRLLLHNFTRLKHNNMPFTFDTKISQARFSVETGRCWRQVTEESWLIRYCSISTSINRSTGFFLLLHIVSNNDQYYDQA
ncbi:hypothetical protein YC2023_022004 [Brassica napus]